MNTNIFCSLRQQVLTCRLPFLVNRCKNDHIFSHGGARLASRAPGKHRGIRKDEGEFVTKGTVIAKQLGLLFHPGLNVGIGKNMNLYALEHGTIVKTTEKCNPNWENQFVERFYGEYKNSPEVPIYKTYFHIIPDPMPQTFKLVDEI